MALSNERPARTDVTTPETTTVGIPATSARLRKIFFGWPVVVVLLGLHWLMAVSAMRQKCATFDEMAHLTGGYSYWRCHDYRLGNGVFLQRWATIPLLSQSLRFPSSENPAWQKSSVWHVGQQFFYELSNPIDSMLLRARAMSALLGVALGLLVYLWSRHLFGPVGGLLSLVLFVFCPTLLGNGALIKADVATALFFLFSTWAWWRLLHKVTVGTVLTSALAMTGLFLTKMSAPLFVIMAVLTTCARLLSSQPMQLCLGRRRWEFGRWKQAAALIPITAVHVLIAFVLIWASFGFRYSAFQTATPGVDKLDPGWEAVLDKPGPVTDVIQLARRWEVLPEAFLFDFAYSYQNTQIRSAFLNGAHSIVGWPMFFPYCFLVKTPLAFFLILGLAITALLCQWRVPGFWYRTLPLWIFLVVYGAFSIRSHINIGHRHLLPVYPVLYVLAGAAAWWFTKKRWVAGIAVLAAVGWFVFASLWIRPHYMAYFNELAGGPRNGYRHLVDSSLDWGQDLPGLKTWLVEEGLDRSDTVTPVYLSYFGTGDPSYYKIAAQRLPGYPDMGAAMQAGPLRGGVYCVSATTLQCVYSPFPGHWAAPYEQLYRQVLSNLSIWDQTQSDPQSRQRLLNEKGEQFWNNQIAFFLQLRFARLCASLRQQEPDAEAGYSILIYRLSDQEVEQALFGPPAELEPRIRIAGRDELTN
jgi:hypothetical protein